LERPWPVAQNQGSALDALSVRVNLGDLHNVEDGLIGYFKAGSYDRIVVPQLPEKITVSDYIGDSKQAVQVGFGPPAKLTLLMDPWGSVQAACGIVPAKTITLANAALDETVAQMETSFRVGPVLVQTDRIALPTTTADQGVWNFSGPLTNDAAVAVAAFDPKHFNDQPIVEPGVRVEPVRRAASPTRYTADDLDVREFSPRASRRLQRSVAA